MTPEPTTTPEPDADAIREAVLTALMDDARRKRRVRLDLEVLKAAAEARSYLPEHASTGAAEALESTIEAAARRLESPWSLP